MQTSQQGVNVDSLFGVDVQYLVPRYQRRYVWNKMNWRTLWEDILYQLGLELVEISGEEDTFKQHEQDEDGAGSGFEDEAGGHFTGPFVTRPISRQHLSRYEVIDGQQRLTTFQIILCVIRDICQSQDCEGLADLAIETEKLIVNTETVIRRNTSERFPDPTYKFRPTDYDRHAFENVANGKYGKAVPEAFNPAKNWLEPKLVQKVRFKVFANKEVSQSILNAYDYFYEQIRAYVGKDCDYGKVDKLISSIKSEFELVQITLDSSDQPEKIFESLNATGRKLSEFDYLRNNLFLRAGAQKVDKETGKLYSDIFYEDYWSFENDSNYWTADRLESFFRVFLIAKLGPYCFQSEDENGKDKTGFEVYQKYYRKVKNKGIKHEFEQLKDYAEFYKEMTDSASKIGSRMQFYEDLKIPSLLPFILYLKWELRISDSDLVKVCTILESYIVRRMINYGYSTNDEDKQAYATIDKFFFGLIKDNKFSVENLVRSLRSCPRDTQIFGGHQHNGRQVLGGLQRTANETYYGKNSARKAAWYLLRYIFYRIEQHIAPKSRLSFGNFLDTPTRIMPEPSRQDRNDWLSIGNLTFRLRNNVSQTQVNNSFFVDTKKVLLEPPNIDFELNKEICQNESWDLIQIGERKEKLYDYFREIWPDLRSQQPAKIKAVEWHFGEIKHWHPNFSHGFIIDEQGKEIRVEKSQLPPISIALLRGGEKVRFEKVQTQESFRAINIELIGPEDG